MSSELDVAIADIGRSIAGGFPRRACVATLGAR